MVSDTGNCVGLDEPPDADPHVRWCERGRLAAAPYSIVTEKRLKGAIMYISS